jgi:hypothetical protein
MLSHHLTFYFLLSALLVVCLASPGAWSGSLASRSTVSVTHHATLSIFCSFIRGSISELGCGSVKSPINSISTFLTLSTAG